MIYFCVSALMDNFAIFFTRSESHCGYVKMVALYSMALVTFLPNCWLAYRYQPSMYDEGKIFWKSMFVLMMIVVTVLSFLFRLVLVYTLGFADAVKAMLK